MKTAILLIVPWCLLSGCVSKERVNAKAAELEMAWRAEQNLPPVPPPETPAAVKEKLLVDAEMRVSAEVAEERRLALEKGIEGAGRIAAGDWIGGILALVGLGGIALGAKKAVA